MYRTLIRLVVTVCFFYFAAGLLQAQDMHKIDLGGKWKFRQAGVKDWKDALVPGTVHQDLLRNKIIEDPFLRDNEKDLQWISDIGWEYEKTFVLKDTFFLNGQIELVCKGLDTYANVYVNDSLVMVADNMFREWFADIKKLLHPGINQVRIQFPAVSAENKSRYSKLERKLPGDERVVCRKAAYQFGWDFGPKLITTGIWRPVYIRYWNTVNVMGVQYIQQKLTDSIANLSAVFTVNSRFADSAQFVVSLDKKILAEKKTMLKKGVNVVRLNFTILNPKRWWSNGLGEAHLYPFEHRVKMGSAIAAKGITKIGLRTIQLSESSDWNGHAFSFKLNGVSVFMKGANYIPQDNFLPRVKDSSYRALIQSAKESNMNMLRVWGGGIYENDIFYDLCDENGILVWQDFMFACGMVPGNKEFYRNVQVEAIQNVVRLRNHPCIAVWCGNNEIDEGWRNWGWQKQYGYSSEDSSAVWMDYKTVFYDILSSSALKFDSLRPYIVSSPRYGWGRPESLKNGDMHYWGVWWGKEPFENYKHKVGKFMSEYGFQGFPPLESLKKFTVPDDLQLKSPVMMAHQKHPVGYETIDEYLNREYKLPKDFTSYVYVSQVLQAEGIKTAIEAHRRAKPDCMGTLYWQFNDCWPGVTWSARDYYGTKKALLFYTKREYSTLLVSPVVEDKRLKVYVVNDSLSYFKAMLKVKLMDFAGNVKYDTIINLMIGNNSSEFYFQSPLEKLAGNTSLTNLLCYTRLFDDKHLFSSNILYFSPAKDQPLENPVITKIIKALPGGYSITLSTDKPARNVWLSTERKGAFSDNYFDLIPGEPQTVIFATKMKAEGFQEQLKIRTLADTF